MQAAPHEEGRSCPDNRANERLAARPGALPLQLVPDLGRDGALVYIDCAPQLQEGRERLVPAQLREVLLAPEENGVHVRAMLRRQGQRPLPAAERRVHVDGTVRKRGLEKRFLGAINLAYDKTKPVRVFTK